jgi:hypothetical protein
MITTPALKALIFAARQQRQKIAYAYHLHEIDRNQCATQHELYIQLTEGIAWLESILKERKDEQDN